MKAAVCCYPTGVHNGKLGKDADAGTFARIPEIKGEMLVVFGDVDPHVPPGGRQMLIDALKSAGVTHRVLIVNGEHAFMRDEGPRYDAAAADQVWGEAIGMFKRVLG